MDAIMDEAFGMATNEQAGWKKRKTPNLAISHEASTASSTPVASTRSSRNKLAGARCPGAQGQRQTTHLEDVVTMMAWEILMIKQTMSTAVWCKFCGNSSRQKLETKISRGLRRLVCETTRKRRGIGTPVGMLKKRSSLSVFHFITQQSSHSRYALCCA